MELQIKKATKSDSKLRLALIGASGSGKTFTALSIGSELGKRILFIDTEHGSASKYADLFDFDVVELSDFAPEKFIQAIKLGEQNNYDLIILDSLSHAWMGKGGILELHGNAEARTKNNFTAWKDVTPKHQLLIEAIVQAKIHVIATMRAKTEYAMKQENGGKAKVQAVGLAPVQRDGMEYEFDVVAHLDEDNNFIVKKTRCPMLSEKVFNKAGINVAEVLKIWLTGSKPSFTATLPQPELPTAEKQDYSQEWNQIIGETTAPKTAPSSPETRGRLFAERGYVVRTNAGYDVRENETQNPIWQLTKSAGIIKCTCPEYADGITDRANFQCAHIIALKLTIQAAQNQTA